MDVIDILGGLLRKKAASAGRSGGVLKDVVGGGQSASRTAARPQSTRPGDIAHDAEELEDLLRVSTHRHTQRTTAAPAPTPGTPRPAAPTAPAPAPTRASGSVLTSPTPPAANTPEERALVLVRAMLNAAKCDGQVSPEEERQILQQVDASSPDTVQFLRDELARPLNVREFAWSVPPGLEQQVYALSLMTMELDTEREAAYLRELAHGLRLSDTVRDQLHQKYKAPPLR